MSEQQSQKEGMRSSAQKETRARAAKAPLPPSNPAGGAFGEPQTKTQTDEDLSSTLSDTNNRKRAESD